MTKLYAPLQIHIFDPGADSTRPALFPILSHVAPNWHIGSGRPASSISYFRMSSKRHYTKYEVSNKVMASFRHTSHFLGSLRIRICRCTSVENDWICRTILYTLIATKTDYITTEISIFSRLIDEAFRADTDIFIRVPDLLNCHDATALLYAHR